MKKVIGVVSNYQNDEDRFWINAAYSKYFSQFGFVTLIDPYQKEVEDVDLLVLPGGSDVNPSRYNNPWHREVGLPNRAYEYFDEVVLPKYVKKAQPIFGICRGLQTLNVLFGGTLKPHVAEPNSYSDGGFAHFVEVTDVSLIKDFNPEKEMGIFECSSNHHQAIDELADGFEVTAIGWAPMRVKGNVIQCSDKRLEIEGIRHVELPIWAVQFHPEKNYNGQDSLDINERFVDPIIRKLLNIEEEENV